MASLVICSCGKSKSTASETPAKSPAKESVAAPVETKAAAEPTSEPETNPRNRPAQPTVDRVYPKPKPPEYPVAAQVDGKPGFVKSPYNDKVIDVTGIPPGTLVQDPTASGAGKNYFRVP